MITVVEGGASDRHFMVLEFSRCGLIVPLAITDAEAEYLEPVVFGVEMPRPMPYRLTQRILDSIKGVMVRSAYITLGEDDRAVGVISILRDGYEQEIPCSVADAGAISKLYDIDLLLDTQIFEKIRYIDRYGLEASEHTALDSILGMGAASFMTYRNA